MQVKRGTLAADTNVVKTQVIKSVTLQSYSQSAQAPFAHQAKLTASSALAAKAKVVRKTTVIEASKRLQQVNNMSAAQKRSAARSIRQEMREYTRASDMTGLGLTATKEAVKLEARASYLEAIAKHKQPNPKVQLSKGLDSALTKVSAAAQKMTRNDDSLGGQIVSGTVTTAAVSYKALKMVEQVAPVAKSATVATVKTVSNAITASPKIVRGTVKNTRVVVQSTAKAVHVVRSQQLYRPTVIAGKIQAQVASSAAKTATVVKNAATTVKQVPTVVRAKITGAVKVVRGVDRGTVANLVKRGGMAAGRAVKQGSVIAARKAINVGGRVIAMGAVRGIVHVRRVTMPNVKRIAGGVSSALSNSDDAMLQGVGMAAKGSGVAIKTGVAVARGTKNSIKTGIETGIKTTKTVQNTYRYVKANGVKKSAATALEKAGKSVVNLLIDAAKALGAKVVVPLLLIVCALSIFASFISSSGSLISTSVTSVGGMFSGVFGISGSDETIIASEFVKKIVGGYVEDDGTTIIGLREDFIDTWVTVCTNKLQGEAYNKVSVSRVDQHGNVLFGANYNKDGVVTTTLPSKSVMMNSFYSVDEIASIITPVFNAIIIAEYNLAPTEAQAQQTVCDIFDLLFSVDVVTDGSEYCAVTGACGLVHSSEFSCVSYVTEYHDAMYFAQCCDKYDCQGHEQTKCDGHGTLVKQCKGHQYSPIGGVYAYLFHIPVTQSSLGQDTTTSPTQDGFVAEPLYPTDSAYDDCDDYTELSGLTYCTDLSACDNQVVETIYHGTELTVDGTTYHVFTHAEQAVNGCANGVVVCTGHRICQGHKAYGLKIGMDGLSELIAYYFTTPIDDLKSREATLTDEEKQELQTLQDCYEILLVMISEVMDVEGNVSASELEEIEFTVTARSGIQSVFNASIDEIGTIGGTTYWTDCGFVERVDWNPCFVYYIMKQCSVTAYTDSSHSPYLTAQTIAMNEVIGKLKNSISWREGTYTDIAAGDVAVIDSNFDGADDKIGIVIGRDDAYVYVVEGNNADMVRCIRYELSGESITGYFLTS